MAKIVLTGKHKGYVAANDNSHPIPFVLSAAITDEQFELFMAQTVERHDETMACFDRLEALINAGVAF